MNDTEHTDDAAQREKAGNAAYTKYLANNVANKAGDQWPFKFGFEAGFTAGLLSHKDDAVGDGSLLERAKAFVDERSGQVDAGGLIIFASHELARTTADLRSKLGEARDALEHYADSHTTWVHSCTNPEPHPHELDCMADKYVAADLPTHPHGYTLARAALTRLANTDEK